MRYIEHYQNTYHRHRDNTDNSTYTRWHFHTHRISQTLHYTSLFFYSTCIVKTGKFVISYIFQNSFSIALIFFMQSPDSLLQISLNQNIWDLMQNRGASNFLVRSIRNVFTPIVKTLKTLFNNVSKAFICFDRWT